MHRRTPESACPRPFADVASETKRWGRADDEMDQRPGEGTTLARGRRTAAGRRRAAGDGPRDRAAGVGRRERRRRVGGAGSVPAGDGLAAERMRVLFQLRMAWRRQARQIAMSASAAGYATRRWPLDRDWSCSLPAPTGYRTRV